MIRHLSHDDLRFLKVIPKKSFLFNKNSDTGTPCWFTHKILAIRHEAFTSLSKSLPLLPK